MNTHLVLAAYLYLEAKLKQGHIMPPSAWHPSGVVPSLAWIGYCEGSDLAGTELLDAASALGMHAGPFLG